MTNGGKKKYSPLVCIAGAGAAGISAALCAGKMGWTVHLTEREKSVGGTVRRGHLHTLTGFLGPGGEVLDSPICREFLERAAPYSQKGKRGKYWVLVMDSERYAEVVSLWLAEFPGVQVHTSASFASVSEGEGMIRSVTLREGTGSVSLTGDLALIDATGGAELAALANARAEHDEAYDSYALTVTAEISAPPPGLMQRIALKAQLEKLLNAGTTVWIDNGSSENKIAVKINSASPGELPAASERIAGFLRGSADLKVTRVWTSEVCNRNGAQIEARPPAGITRENSFLVSWPFETWRGGEVHLEDPPEMPFLLSENYLRSRAYGNLYAAGKSAGIPRPFASAARAVGSCWTMGEQVVRMIARGAR